MAQETIVRLIDDLDKSEAAETVEFGLDGKQYEIELSESHAQALRENLAEFIAAARKVSKAQAPTQLTSARGRRSSTGGTAADKRAQSNAVREWARQNGHSVSDRGRISQAIQRAFDEAHGSAA